MASLVRSSNPLTFEAPPVTPEPPVAGLVPPKASAAPVPPVPPTPPVPPGLPLIAPVPASAPVAPVAPTPEVAPEEVTAPVPAGTGICSASGSQANAAVDRRTTEAKVSMVSVRIIYTPHPAWANEFNNSLLSHPKRREPAESGLARTIRIRDVYDDWLLHSGASTERRSTESRQQQLFRIQPVFTAEPEPGPSALGSQGAALRCSPGGSVRFCRQFRIGC